MSLFWGSKPVSVFYHRKSGLNREHPPDFYVLLQQLRFFFVFVGVIHHVYTVSQDSAVWAVILFESNITHVRRFSRNLLL